ncbi:hypothetical protein Pan44_55580 [Caulifigura coniformis]|uniref:Uncharacterized protein n=1 Tax=Caulifigura coniformis TaxID=2527983 RepID=A0A517SMY7_9PLAN|nr:hypothetical protein [Caulifigura coniformis]QDT57489.1 hypothetical protein Pan44_55580 [Caulifigura coniformis]
MQLTIRDETTDGRAVSESVVDFLTETITVEELIRGRVYQEVQDYNLKKKEKFQGLVDPSADRTAAGRRDIDWKAQFQTACEAFRQNRVLILVDDRQVERLDQTIQLRPNVGEAPATSVTFLKLTPLVGG